MNLVLDPKTSIATALANPGKILDNVQDMLPRVIGQPLSEFYLVTVLKAGHGGGDLAAYQALVPSDNKRSPEVLMEVARQGRKLTAHEAQKLFGDLDCRGTYRR